MPWLLKNIPFCWCLSIIFMWTFFFNTIILDKVELVKNAMASFSLPQMNIPVWAKDVTDDKLKETLEKSISSKNTK